ncbi:MAG: NlpC/P60 family protein [Solibacillus sp.]
MKKLLITFAALLIFLTPLHSLPANADALYTDVSDQFRAKAEFDFLVERGILQPNDQQEFGINEAITRIEAVQILADALALDVENAPTVTFPDVASEDTATVQLTSAVVQANIMKGNEHGEFRPHDPLTRAQMATILVRAFQLEGKATKSFPDVHADQLAIHTLVANRITTGFEDGTFRPNASITKANFVVFLARILNKDFRKDIVEVPAALPVNSCVKPLKTPTYKIDVEVSNLWDKPTIARKVDNPSLTNPTNMGGWVKNMRLSEKRWLIDRVHTQSLYGDEVTILKSSGNWYRVALNDQYVAYQKEGYPGWVPKSHVTKVTEDYSDCAIAIVTAKFTPLYNEINKAKFMNISYATILPVVGEDKKFYHVQTPANGVKLLKKEDSKSFASYKDVPKPTAKTIIDEAKRYLGLPYLWAGISPHGYDCSGILYAVYRAHGIMLPRDSFYQATKGKAVAKKNLMPGDLVFFAYGGGTGKVYHVALYIGNGKMLHAPNASSKVRIESLNQGVYLKNYSGARRYLD